MATSLQFTIEEVFYIKPPVDRVILVGTIQEGTIHTGDVVVVECRGGPVSAVVEGIESINQGEIQLARKGQQIGLRVQGIKKDQPWKGDRVTRKSDG